jgi:hypothetical protein
MATSEHKVLHLFKKNPKAGNAGKTRSLGSQKLFSKVPSVTLSTEKDEQAEEHSSVDFPGLTFIDDEFDDEQQKKVLLSPTSKVEKKAGHWSNDNIEYRPKPDAFKHKGGIFKRDINSPSKSLNLEPKDLANKEYRRSSLSIFALKAAAQVSSPCILVQDLQASTNLLASMISLPGVPPVSGVHDQGHLHRQMTKKYPSINSSRLQSEEDLILDFQRKQEFSVMRPTKLKEESTILKNIQKREMMDKIHKGSIEKREKQEKKKLQEHFGIASGIIKSRVLLVAPVTPVAPILDDNDFLIPPPLSDHPNQRRIVRKVVAARIHQSPELIVQAETRFSESPFVLECLEWHNTFRKSHSSPPLTLDPIVS